MHHFDMKLDIQDLVMYRNMLLQFGNLTASRRLTSFIIFDFNDNFSEPS